MSTFYGQIQGNRGAATRGGSKASGYRASAQSWDGSVIVDMNYNKDDNLEVDIRLSEGSSNGWGADLVFTGSMAELREAFALYRKHKAKKNAKVVK